jgi:uroporphyrinogen decarboxylase
MSMTPRQRVLATLRHEEPDRVPIIIGVSNSTGLKMGAYRRLKEHLVFEAEERYLYDWPELGTAEVDETMLERLRGDVRGVLDAHPAEVLRRNRARPPGSPFVDSWGIGQVEVSPGEWFPGIHPLAEAETVADLDDYKGWPDPSNASRLDPVRQRAKSLAEEGRYAVLATPWLLFPFERACALRGMDRLLLDLAARPDVAEALLHSTVELCKALMEPFLRAAGDDIDMIKIGDDLGTQAGLLISPEMYRRILKPIHADYIAFIKQRTHAKVFFHTDGDVFDLVGDLIEIGIDILHPIQTSAGRMADLAALKAACGRDVVLCGAIDTHRILPHGSPAEVTDEVRRVIDILAPGGGYMVAAVHTIMNDVPPENILAMVDAVERFGRYPIHPR